MGIDVGALSAVHEDVVKAALEGNKDKLKSIKEDAVAQDDSFTKSIVDKLIDNLTEPVIKKLGDLQTANTESSKELERAVTDLNKEMGKNSDMKDYAKDGGLLQADGTFAETEGLARQLDSLEKQADDFRKSIENTERALDILSTAATKRHILGNSTGEEKKRLQDYNDSHPKD
jgi:hypothetical protein